MPLAALPKALGLQEEEKDFSFILLTVQNNKPVWNCFYDPNGMSE